MAPIPTPPDQSKFPPIDPPPRPRTLGERLSEAGTEPKTFREAGPPEPINEVRRSLPPHDSFPGMVGQQQSVGRHLRFEDIPAPSGHARAETDAARIFDLRAVREAILELENAKNEMQSAFHTLEEVERTNLLFLADVRREIDRREREVLERIEKAVADARNFSTAGFDVTRSQLGVQREQVGEISKRIDDLDARLSREWGPIPERLKWIEDDLAALRKSMQPQSTPKATDFSLPPGVHEIPDRRPPVAFRVPPSMLPHRGESEEREKALVDALQQVVDHPSTLAHNLRLVAAAALDAHRSSAEEDAPGDPNFTAGGYFTKEGTWVPHEIELEGGAKVQFFPSVETEGQERELVDVDVEETDYAREMDGLRRRLKDAELQRDNFRKANISVVERQDELRAELLLCSNEVELLTERLERFNGSPGACAACGAIFDTAEPEEFRENLRVHALVCEKHPTAKALAALRLIATGGCDRVQRRGNSKTCLQLNAIPCRSCVASRAIAEIENGGGA